MQLSFLSKPIGLREAEKEEIPELPILFFDILSSIRAENLITLANFFIEGESSSF
jgi:hypothetical protein